MKINEIIKERRLAHNYTQEQMATYLGVTAPAVNKWEKGTTYPDISILPALARLLNTDLNTLLSFKDDLTEQEIGLFLNQLSEIADKNGFEQAYETAVKKIEEYPTCHTLILNTALVLDGVLMFDKNKKKDFENKQSDIESLYERVLSSEQSSVRNQAQSILISKYMGQKEYAKAENLLKELPDKNQVDKKHIQANLFIAYNKLGDAARLEEEKLLSATSEINTALLTLLDIALKEHRMEDAEYIANVSKKTAELFDLCNYNSYVAHFQLYSACKNRTECLKVLIPMLKSLKDKWDINASPLYRHIKTKESNNEFGSKFQKSIISCIYEDEETSFLQSSQELRKIADEINSEETI